MRTFGEIADLADRNDTGDMLSGLHGFVRDLADGMDRLERNLARQLALAKMPEWYPAPNMTRDGSPGMLAWEEELRRLAARYLEALRVDHPGV